MAADNFKVDLQWAFRSYSGDAGLAVPVQDGGIFMGPAVVIQGPYTQPEPITFTVLAWDGVDYAHSTGTGSVTWTEPFLDPYPQGQLHMPTLYVQFIPEPLVLALAGLGAAAMLIARRRE
jgi:outer membrane protein assembly factor BamB